MMSDERVVKGNSIFVRKCHMGNGARMHRAASESAWVAEARASKATSIWGATGRLAACCFLH